ncbi:hypothetical protein BT63DRAFT_141580 [Microthyrium microscopicum]|uniref:Uncharacterized protein n=1 Tax=Microthyrium microscopicum TaxID=703497 RepID=A0A6A6UNA4_9PEZI|nr:hypothetical protein BT63DRAFT_141580 [Microthyrium microscopicum]
MGVIEAKFDDDDKYDDNDTSDILSGSQHSSIQRERIVCLTCLMGWLYSSSSVAPSSSFLPYEVEHANQCFEVAQALLKIYHRGALVLKPSSCRPFYAVSLLPNFLHHRNFPLSSQLATVTLFNCHKLLHRQSLQSLLQSTQLPGPRTRI